MHPFPPAHELQRFATDVIEQVSLHLYTVQFIFESGCQIMAAHRVEHVEPNGTVWSYDCHADKGAPVILQRLLYRLSFRSSVMT